MLSRGHARISHTVKTENRLRAQAKTHFHTNIFSPRKTFGWCIFCMARYNGAMVGHDFFVGPTQKIPSEIIAKHTPQFTAPDNDGQRTKKKNTQSNKKTTNKKYFGELRWALYRWWPLTYLAELDFSGSLGSRNFCVCFFFFVLVTSCSGYSTDSAVHRLNASSKHFRFQFVDKMYRILGGQFFQIGH